jgi:hypothetical protein
VCTDCAVGRGRGFTRQLGDGASSVASALRDEPQPSALAVPLSVRRGGLLHSGPSAIGVVRRSWPAGTTPFERRRHRLPASARWRSREIACVTVACAPAWPRGSRTRRSSSSWLWHSRAEAGASRPLDALSRGRWRWPVWSSVRHACLGERVQSPHVRTRRPASLGPCLRAWLVGHVHASSAQACVEHLQSVADRPSQSNPPLDGPYQTTQRPCLVGRWAVARASASHAEVFVTDCIAACSSDVEAYAAVSQVTAEFSLHARRRRATQLWHARALAAGWPAELGRRD